MQSHEPSTLSCAAPAFFLLVAFVAGYLAKLVLGEFCPEKPPCVKVHSSDVRVCRNERGEGLDEIWVLIKSEKLREIATQGDVHPSYNIRLYGRSDGKGV